MRLPGLIGMEVAAQKVMEFSNSLKAQVKITTPKDWIAPTGFPTRTRLRTNRNGTKSGYTNARGFLLWAKRQES